jgi:hypothetical protein
MNTGLLWYVTARDRIDGELQRADEAWRPASPRPDALPLPADESLADECLADESPGPGSARSAFGRIARRLVHPRGLRSIGGRPLTSPAERR